MEKSQKNGIESVKLKLVELILSFFLLIHRSFFAIMNLKEYGILDESIESWFHGVLAMKNC